MYNTINTWYLNNRKIEKFVTEDELMLFHCSRRRRAFSVLTSRWGCSGSCPPPSVGWTSSSPRQPSALQREPPWLCSCTEREREREREREGKRETWLLKSCKATWTALIDWDWLCVYSWSLWLTFPCVERESWVRMLFASWQPSSPPAPWTTAGRTGEPSTATAHFSHTL